MAAEDRRWTGAGYGTLQRRRDRVSLRRAGYDRDRGGHAHEERDAEGQRGARDVLEPRERAVVDLLVPAGLVERDDADVEGLQEIATGWIDEREVPVLADPEDRQLRALAPQEIRVAAGLGLEIGGFPVQAVER